VSPPDPYSFTFEPLFLALAALAGLLYLRAARSQQLPWWRPVLFVLGLALVALPLNSPLETLAVDYLLLVHLLQNVMIADWAPPLLILGLTPAMRASIARRGGRPFAWITQLRVALPLWLLGWYLIHLAAFYDAALENAVLLNLEHLLLLAIGLVFWWPVFASEPHAVSTPYRIGYLFVGFLGSMFLGLALTFAGSAFYDFYERAPRLWGLSVVEDQNLGGVLMTAEQAIVFLAAITYFLLRLLKEEEEKERLLRERDAALLREWDESS
jgi:putative membrane protein